jgi:hypothetical protein
MSSPRHRQRRILLACGGALIVVGLSVALLLTRLPLPLRTLTGLVDVFAGCFLLLVVRQKFPRK